MLTKTVSRRLLYYGQRNKVSNYRGSRISGSQEGVPLLSRKEKPVLSEDKREVKIMHDPYPPFLLNW